MPRTEKAVAKPPAQSIGVNSIEPEPMGEIGGGVSFIHDWKRLSEVPKFQTFAYEQCKKPYDEVEKWIVPFILDVINASGEQFLYELYLKWHDDKGYWKNEDLYGNLIETEKPIGA